MSERNVITIDCDNVIIPSTIHYIRIYNEQYGTNVELQFAQTPGYDGWNTDYESIGERIYAIQQSEEFLAVEPFPDAVEVMGLLQERYELHVVTARPAQLMGATACMLDEHFPDIFESVIYTGHAGSKGKVAAQLGADTHVDDARKHLEDTDKHGVGHSILFGNYPWQTDDPEVKRLSKCKDWHKIFAKLDQAYGNSGS